MNKTRFIDFVQDNILKLFTGSEIIGEEESTFRDSIVAQADGGAIKIKFTPEDNFRIIIKRAQPFKAFEMQLVKSVIEEMRKVVDLNLGDDYKKGFKNLIIEKAICKSLSNTSSKTISLILSEMNYWSQRTYEGNRTSLGCIVTNKKQGKGCNPNLHISKVFKNDFSALLTDGKTSFMEISADGYISDYICHPKQIDFSLFAPYEFLQIATLSTGSKIGISLNEQGDMLIFKNKSLVFARRGGNWICYSHDEIVSKLSEHAGEFEDVRKSIYLSALDASFNRSGGCIVHINNGDRTGVLKHIDEADVLSKEAYDFIQQEKINQSFFNVGQDKATEIPNYEDFLQEEKCTKIVTLAKLINGRKFQELDRKFCQELIAIDGALIIDYNGEILAIGAIIKIEAGSSGGGRLAAAKTLSNYGISIKISNEGSMQGFKMDKNKLRAKTIFVL